MSTFENDLVVKGFAYLNDTRISSVGVENVTEEEAGKYLDEIKKQYPEEKITTLEIKGVGNSHVELSYSVQPPKFIRIRRITGYLVGELDRFNDAKRAEEGDRVKHGLEGAT